MKNLTYVSIALLLLIALFEACDKKNLAPVFQGQLVASSRTVTKNQPDSLTVVGADNDVVVWTVSPEGYNIVKRQGNKIILSFSQFGVYTVSASVNGAKAITQTISCTDFSNYYTSTPLDNEELTLTPHLYKLPTTDSTFFNFQIETSKTHQCRNSAFNLSQTQNKNNYIVYIDGLLEPKTDCILSNSKLVVQTQFFYPQADEPITLGVAYPLTINVGTKTYIGSVVFSKTYMDITWNYTSGVVMSAKHITLSTL